MSQRTHYPRFHVLNEKAAWDEHTRSIVTSRTTDVSPYRFLTGKEADALFLICGLLVNDFSPDVLRFVVGHIDRTLYASTGEGQRQEGVPAAADLIRLGLQALDNCTKSNYYISFHALDRTAQKQLLQSVSGGTAHPQSEWKAVPQQPFFRKLMSLTVESYCSHPKVWSEIGYAGPAYPRGYVRAQLGQADPWEARQEQ
ncbi:gluconate 2-dehydrogenase subunit 3 family protein [Paenibacillus piri]|uniref:Gluconate 2-dehydrogenase subunit 3 family protein n=1 Tax=Paenibacillus piri TaxID=2547395 RepID=A0A4R5KI08_9BACL|nr:gluconate 2-dehydrogenase subunit 3 family protein [Paenibacillus piri]TDF95073.1 gluconate 2-dehydrogenase subunit 3 family protein [Paenibacillus piri]